MRPEKGKLTPDQYAAILDRHIRLPASLIFPKDGSRKNIDVTIETVIRNLSGEFSTTGLTRRQSRQINGILKLKALVLKKNNS